MVRLRSPLPSPTSSVTPTSSRIIQFRHPAYSDTCQPLLRLSSIDSDDENGKKGIDYDTAFLACCILTGERYYFCLDRQEPTYKYPVLPSFDHWRFPHDDLPCPWSELAIAPTTLDAEFKQKQAMISRNVTCRISGYYNATEAAHLVPVSAGGWFKSNEMERYCLIPYDALPINDEQNMVLLRRDLHYLFDQRRFTFAVKRSDDQLGQLVTHILQPLPRGATELLNLYHNRALHALSGISVELLCSRFAFSIFADEFYPFLTGNQVYAVQLFNDQNSEYTTQHLRTLQIRSKSLIFDPISRSRSVSPRKRQLSQDAVDDDDVGSSLNKLDRWDTDDAESEWEEMEVRGRRRKRS